MLDESKSILLLFDIVSTTFIPGKISSEKKVSKLRSIAELRAFYRILSMLSVVLHLPIGVAVVAALLTHALQADLVQHLLAVQLIQDNHPLPLSLSGIFQFIPDPVGSGEIRIQ